MLQEAIMGYLICVTNCDICLVELEKLRETWARTVCLSAEIRTWGFSDTKQKFYKLEIDAE
jgi:hypothetical protein